jgi:hypothetical protein
VFNVSMSLLRDGMPDRPYRLIEVSTTEASSPDALERRRGTDRRTLA